MAVLSKTSETESEVSGRLLRCFVAVEVTAPAVRRALEGVQGELRRAFGAPDPVKWVPAHQFHFTLKFLGEIAEEAAARAAAAVERSAAGLAPFTLGIAGLGAFPSVDQPSVLWAGVGEGREPLVALAGTVEREMAEEGFAPERRRFQPHLTLGRVREGARVPRGVSGAIARAAGRDFGRWQVEQLVLMKSELTPRGPVYTPLQTFCLREEKA